MQIPGWSRHSIFRISWWVRVTVRLFPVSSSHRLKALFMCILGSPFPPSSVLPLLQFMGVDNIPITANELYFLS